MSISSNPYDHIIWSADLPDVPSLVRVLDQLPQLEWVKIDRLFMINNDFKIFDILHDRMYKVFVDEKAIEVDHKLEGIARAHAKRSRPHTLNCMAGAVTFSDKRQVDALRRFAAVCAENNIASCGVSVLTSKDEQVVGGEFNGRTPAEQVEWYALQLAAAGFERMVCSPNEAAIIKSNPELAHLSLMTPGIRPAGAGMGSQSRAATPAEAIRQARTIW